MSNSSVAPFVKWAGGKRQLLPQIKERMPEKYNNYFEPFVGGGAATFELLPANALINDINKALINAYKQICNAPEAFLKAVKKLDEEIGELCEAIKAGVKNHAAKEVADVYIVSRVLANRFNSWIGNYFLGLLDEYPVPRMMSEVKKKMEINKKRKWHRVDGVYRHKEEE